MRSEQTPGDSEGQRSLVCCSPWGHKELDATEQQKNVRTHMVNGSLFKLLDCYVGVYDTCLFTVKICLNNSTMF